MNILYIHGYNGDPYGQSYQNLKNACKDKHELFTIDYKANDPKDAIKLIRKFVNENKIDLIIGASLGGFLTMKIFGVSRIVVNPCWDPATELPKIGYTDDIESYKKLLNELVENIDIEERNLCSGVFSNKDELLGNKYANVFRQYFKQQYNIIGRHRISESMAQEIIDNIVPLHDEEIKIFCKQLKGIDNAPWLDE